MSKLRCGAIGLGMGLHHARCFHNNPHCDLVAVADPNPEVLKERAAEFGDITVYASGEEMIEKERLDIVSVATPNKFHAPLTIAALESGAHVVCEKPMAMHAAEAQTMIDAATKAKRRIIINFSYRFHPQAWAMKQEMPALGDIYYGRTLWTRRLGMPRFGGWFGQKELSGGGPLIDLGVHRLDLALWLMDYPTPTWVMGSTYDHIAAQHAKQSGKAFDVEDFAVALIKFDNGATLELVASWAGHTLEKERMETQLLGTKGGIHQINKNEGYEYEFTIHTDRKGVPYDLTPHGDVTGGPGNVVDHLVDCINQNKPHMGSGEEGLTVMKILDAIYESAEKGIPIEIKPA